MSEAAVHSTRSVRGPMAETVRLRTILLVDKSLSTGMVLLYDDAAAGAVPSATRSIASAMPGGTRLQAASECLPAWSRAGKVAGGSKVAHMSYDRDLSGDVLKVSIRTA